MSSKSGALLSAGLGAAAAVATVLLARKVKKYVTGNKPKMRLFHNNLLMSTRCSWLISELGIEREVDFQVTDPDQDSRYTSTECLIIELEHISNNQRRKIRNRSVRQEEDYQVVSYSPYVSCEDLRLARAGGELPELLTTDLHYHSCDTLFPGGTTSPLPPPTMAPPRIALNDEFTMIEGAAICMYLADLYGQFLPDQQHKAEYYSWIVYSAATFDNIVKTLHHQLVELSEPQRNRFTLESALLGFNAFARALSETLSRNRYLCGDRFTAADCVLGFTLWWAYTIERGRLLDGYPVLSDYLSLLQSRPAFEKTFGREEKWDWGQYFRRYIAQIEG